MLYAGKFAAAGDEDLLQDVSFVVGDVDVFFGIHIFDCGAFIHGQGVGGAVDGDGHGPGKSAVGGRSSGVLPFAVQDPDHGSHFFLGQLICEADVADLVGDGATGGAVDGDTAAGGEGKQQ